MAYDPTVAQPMVIAENTQSRIYTYLSADAAATVSADDYFTDGLDLGMKQGDLVNVIDRTAGTSVIAVVNFS